MVTALPAPAAQKVSPRNFEAKLQPRARMAAVIGKTRKTVVLPDFTEKDTAAATTVRRWWDGLSGQNFMTASL